MNSVKIRFNCSGASTWKLENWQFQSVPLRKHCELVTVTQFQSGKTFCTLNWWFQKLHYQLLKNYTINYSKTTLSTTLESGNWKKLTISECPMEEAMRIGHWVTIQQFHSGKKFLHYELVISSKWKQARPSPSIQTSCDQHLLWSAKFGPITA